MPQRQLAAIMFVDIVGYTSLMGIDEAKALKSMRASKEIQKPLVEKYNGIWVKEIGDGALSQFSSALDAVNCAIEIQKTARETLDSSLRIGVHLGDITIENGDVYGDGVNVASRLQSITDPGGIFISDAIHKAIGGHTEIESRYLGEIRLRNVEYGVRTYALQGNGLPIYGELPKKDKWRWLWTEIVRRGVIRASIAYLGFAFLLTLILSRVHVIVEIPNWLDQSLNLFLIIGFPIAIYLAWKYEKSPSGFVLTTSQQSLENPYNGKRKPLTSNYILIGLFVMVISIYLYPDKNENVEALQKTREKSIAVLPFTNLSDDESNQYFTDGIMEAILNHLTKIEGLKVISRTSVLQYRMTEKTVTTIANELNVAYILEGSLQRYQDKVRINAQLIDASTDLHLWSNNYDRDLTDIFEIQSEVAQEIANKLKIQISPGVLIRMESFPTENTQAYNLYLQAMFHNREFSTQGFNRAVELLNEAISVDPNFADAYATLGILWLGAGAWGGEVDPQSSLQMAIPLLNKALEIDPNLEQGHLGMAFQHLWFNWDFNAAETEYLIALKLNPSDVEVMINYADLLMSTGRFEEAVKFGEKALELDPMSNLPWQTLGLAQYFNGQPVLAIETFRNAMKVHSNPEILNEAGRAYLYLNQFDEVISLLNSCIQNFPNWGPPPRLLGNLAIAYYKNGEIENSEKVLNQLIEKTSKSSVGSPSFYTAMVYSAIGKSDLAMQWLDKSYSDREVEMYWLDVEPFFVSLYEDARFQDLHNRVISRSIQIPKDQ